MTAMPAFTTQKPTKPGWHWYRTGELDAEPTLAWVCEIAGKMNVVWPNGQSEHVLEMPGQWAGPVVRPDVNE